MFENTRAAKRRRTSSYNPSSASKHTPPTAANGSKTQLRSLQRSQIPNGHTDERGNAEQIDDADEDELGAENSPIAANTRRRVGRFSKPSTPTTPADNASATKSSKTTESHRLKSTSLQQKRSRGITSGQSHKSNLSPSINGVHFHKDVVPSTRSATDEKQTRKRRASSLANYPQSDDEEAADALIRASLDVSEVHPKLDSVSLLAGPCTETLKVVVLEKIAGKRVNSLIGLDDERQKVHNLLEQTITAGEGNSMLIIGARGTGKSTMVYDLLKKFSRDNQEYFHVIRLNGFIQTDDKLALREIWRQLGREMAVEEEAQARNYSDTLATLLAILSHPAEISSEVNSDQVAKSVIFILDEFDLFASHPRQTLLYNLFDIAQSRKAPIAVLGLTTRVDIAESLEKRVKSRFSHRYVHLGLPKDLTSFTDTCRSVLQIQREDLTVEEQAQLCQLPPATAQKGNAKANQKTNRQPLQTVLRAWNEAIDALFHDPLVTTHLARIYHTTRSLPTALTTFIVPISQLSSDNGNPGAFNLSLLPLTLPPDSKLTLLPSLPTLAVSLLIAAARLDIILDTDLCNFNMAYDEYVGLTAKARIAASATSSAIAGVAKVWSREAARSMWERLLELELLVRVGGTGTGTGGGVIVVPDTEMVKCDVALEEIEGAIPDLEKGLEKWCREI